MFFFKSRNHFTFYFPVGLIIDQRALFPSLLIFDLLSFSNTTFNRNTESPKSFKHFKRVLKKNWWRHHKSKRDLRWTVTWLHNYKMRKSQEMWWVMNFSHFSRRTFCCCCFSLDISFIFSGKPQANITKDCLEKSSSRLPNIKCMEISDFKTPRKTGNK